MWFLSPNATNGWIRNGNEKKEKKKISINVRGLTFFLRGRARGSSLRIGRNGEGRKKKTFWSISKHLLENGHKKKFPLPSFRLNVLASSTFVQNGN
jgi:hypothetical protein